jgi:hypothetical protein
MTSETPRPDTDEERDDPEHARIRAETRPVTHDQEPAGDQGISSDKPGVDGGGYPERT